MSIPPGPELVAVAVALNVPFGTYRATVPRLSLRWFLAIHLPIPLIVLLRIGAGYGFDFIPWLLMGTVAGQIVGSGVYARWRSRQLRAPRPDPDPSD